MRELIVHKGVSGRELSAASRGQIFNRRSFQSFSDAVVLGEDHLEGVGQITAFCQVASNLASDFLWAGSGPAMRFQEFCRRKRKPCQQAVQYADLQSTRLHTSWRTRYLTDVCSPAEEIPKTSFATSRKFAGTCHLPCFPKESFKAAESRLNHATLHVGMSRRESLLCAIVVMVVSIITYIIAVLHCTCYHRYQHCIFKQQ